MFCHHAQCHYAECHYAECYYAQCHYAECHYADCRYTECRGAIGKAFVIFQGGWRILVAAGGGIERKQSLRFFPHFFIVSTYAVSQNRICLMYKLETDATKSRKINDQKIGGESLENVLILSKK